MNTLRILSLVCGTSRVKYPIVLLTLFLFWPAFASADCSPAQPCVVTSGTAVVDPNAPCPDNIIECAPFNFAGRDFSASGLVIDPEGTGNLPLGDKVFEPGSFFDAFFGGSTQSNLQFELTVNGVPWGIPAGSDAGVVFFATLFIPGNSQAVSAPFSFEGFFKGAPEPFPPGLGCDVLKCVNLEFRGGGIATYDVTESGIAPGWFEVDPPLTFTFTAVPEPSRCPCSPSALLVWRCGQGRRRAPHVIAD
jgi:hypothetical protein